MATKRVPIQTPFAPSARAEARPAPVVIPPAARTGFGATSSTTPGTRAPRAIRPVCPPASVPWAQTMSAPASATFLAARGVPTSEITGIPRSWRCDTQGPGFPSPDAKTGTASSRTICICSSGRTGRPSRPSANSPAESARSSSVSTSGRSDGGRGSSTSPVVWIGRRRSTPKGRSVSSRVRWISRRSRSGVNPAPPRTPSPPAFETAAVSSARETNPIPAQTTGWSIPRISQISVRSGSVMARGRRGNRAARC